MSSESPAIIICASFTHMYFILFFLCNILRYRTTTNLHPILGKRLLNLRRDVNSSLVDVFTGSYDLCTKHCVVNLARGAHAYRQMDAEYRC